MASVAGVIHRRTTTNSGVACGRVNWLTDDTSTVEAKVSCERCRRVMSDPIQHGLPLDKVVPNIPESTVTAGDHAVLRSIEQQFSELLQRITHESDDYRRERAMHQAIRLTLVHIFGTVERFNLDPMFHAQVQLAETFLNRIYREIQRP